MYLIQTVQTSWRPQLPLPKEVHISNENDVDKTTTNNYISEMERLHHSSSSTRNKKDNISVNSNVSSGGGGSNKKWSFGRLFRRKKEIESDSSSEEDRKAGFIPAQKHVRGSSVNNSSKTKSKNKNNRSSKLIGAGFDHIVVNPQHASHQHPQQPQHVENEFFLPVETISSHHREPYYQMYSQQQKQQPHSQSANSLDRRSARSAHKSRSSQRPAHADGAHSSSEGELISLNSSTFSKYRSDESIHSGGQGANNGQSRRSRAARNERYYKRLSRDGEVSHGQMPVMYAPQPVQRWKTQPVPLSVYNGPIQQHQLAQVVRNPATAHQAMPTQSAQRLRNTSSLQHVAPYMQWGQFQKLQQQQQPKNLQNSVNNSKRSISYDSQIHLQNVHGRLQTKPLPPPPPPRDPLRRVHVSGSIQNGSSGDLRPLSYAFDQNGLPVLPASGLNKRCVSDDKIWSGQMPQYQSVHSLNIPATQPPQSAQPSHNRRYITRSDRDTQSSKKSLPNGIDFHYVADATPRSRKPIHMLDPYDGKSKEPPPSVSILRTTKSGLPSSPKFKASDFWKRLDEGSQRKGRDVERASNESTAKPRSISSSRIGDLRSFPIPMYSEVHKPNRKPQLAVQSQKSSDEVDNIVCGSLHIKSSQDKTNNIVEIRQKDENKRNAMLNQQQQQRHSGEILTTPNKYDEYVAEKREQHHKPLYNPPTPPQRKLSLPHNAPPIQFPRKKPANLEEAINELEAIYKSLGLTEEPEKKERVPTPSDFEKFALAHADEYDDDESPTGEPDPVHDDVAYRNIKLANLQHKTAEKQPPFGIPLGPIVPSPQTDYLNVAPIELRDKPSNAPDVVKDDLAVRALRKDPPGPKERFLYPPSSLQRKNRATRTQSANIYSLIQRDAAKPSGGDLYSYLELTKNMDRTGSMSDIGKDDSASDIPATLILLRNLKEQELNQSENKKAQIPFRHPSQGGAICQLPEKLGSPCKEDIQKPPVPLPRKSLTPEPTNVTHQIEDALNKIAKDAQESSAKLSRELQELRKEALITASRPKAKINPEEEKLEKELQEIEAVSEAAKRCGKMLLETLPDASDGITGNKPRKLHKEGKLIKAIDQVSEAANAVCEKILKDIVTAEPPVVVHEAVQVKSQPEVEDLVMPKLIKKLDPIKSDNIEAIAKRCMRQLSELGESADYDNLADQEVQHSAVACNATEDVAQKVDTIICTVPEVVKTIKTKPKEIEEIDKIMQECEAQARSSSKSGQTKKADTNPVSGVSFQVSSDDRTTAPSMTTSSSSSNAAPPTKNNKAPASSTTASSFSSSSDCLAKSSSPSGGRRQSSSITSFNPYSSSDYLKSPSSDYHALSTDPIKTFSTTSYEVQSTSATPNVTTNSTFSYSPSPPLNLTPVSGRAHTAAAATAEAENVATIEVTERNSEERARSSSPSQYNSSEELAMIFGIEEKTKQDRQKQKQQQQAKHTGKVGASTTHKTPNVPSSLSSYNHASFLKPASAKITNPNAACCKYVEQANNPTCLNVVVDATCSTTTTTTTTTTNTTNIITTNINSPTNLSPISCKLETIPETLVEQDQDSRRQSNTLLKLSPNFNQIYASKISIFVDRALEKGALTELDLLSSLEETSSNPDSGNVSLADYPLQSSNANACLQLQTAYNSRFEVRNTTFVSEMCIETKIEPRASAVESAQEKSLTNEFPRLPTTEELLASLGEGDYRSSSSSEASDQLEFTCSISEDYTSLLENVLTDEASGSEAAITSNDVSLVAELGTPIRKGSTVVYETPQLEMNISEVKLNYELTNALANGEDSMNNDNTDNNNSTDASDKNDMIKTMMSNVEEQRDVLAQIRQCTEEVERLNTALQRMPRRRCHYNQPIDNAEASQSSCTPEGRLVPRHLQVPLLPPSPSPSRHPYHHDDTDDVDDEKPTTSSIHGSTHTGVVSILGELRPANSLTTLEHILVACSIGVISPNDLYTLFLIIIAVITIIAIVLI